MAQLGIPTKGNKRKKDKSSTSHSYRLKNNYSNADAVSNVIHYITRTRENENRDGDLLGYGGVGVVNDLHPNDMIQQFLYIQNEYHIDRRRGKRMYHEVLNFYDHEVALWNLTPEDLCRFGMVCSRIYYNMGYQVVFAVHYEQDKRYHIHFAVNSVSFVDGKKWHTSLSEIKQREAVFNQILCDMVESKLTRSPIFPFYG